VSAYGYDEVAKQKCFGLRVHARIAWPGVVCDLELLPANVHDTVAAESMLMGIKGQVIADRNYWKPVLMERLREQDLALLTPFATVKHQKAPWPRKLTRKRYRIETVFGQFVQRFKARAVWARDAWHLCSRWLRRILAHCFGVFLCQQTGLPPLRFSELVNV
jgi:IS5 family transposase